MDRLFVALLSESTRLGIVDVLCIYVIIAGGALSVHVLSRKLPPLASK